MEGLAHQFDPLQLLLNVKVSDTILIPASLIISKSVFSYIKIKKKKMESIEDGLGKSLKIVINRIETET